MEELAAYGLRLAPGLAVIGLTVVLLGRRAAALRIALLVIGFVLLRDLMTPFGFWVFGRTDAGLPWLRFTDDGVLLTVFGVATVATVGVLLRAQPDLAALVRWGRLDVRAVGTALLAAAAVLVPLFAVMLLVPLAERGGAVPISLLLPLLVLAFGGNFLEEVLFRGFLQGKLEADGLGPIRTILVSGLFFAAGHVFLAATVTDLGWPVLVFTLAEGLACAWVRHRSGVLAATLTHGLVIFVLASGW